MGQRNSILGMAMRVEFINSEGVHVMVEWNVPTSTEIRPDRSLWTSRARKHMAKKLFARDTDERDHGKSVGLLATAEHDDLYHDERQC